MANQGERVTDGIATCEHGNPVGHHNYNEWRCTECDRNGPQLDLADPVIRDMAERNHTPHEVWRNTGQLCAVRCDTCGHEWPCPTVIQLRDLRT